jgi:hypothetical protein
MHNNVRQGGAPHRGDCLRWPLMLIGLLALVSVVVFMVNRYRETGTFGSIEIVRAAFGLAVCTVIALMVALGLR